MIYMIFQGSESSESDFDKILDYIVRLSERTWIFYSLNVLFEANHKGVV